MEVESFNEEAQPWVEGKMGISRATSTGGRHGRKEKRQRQSNGDRGMGSDDKGDDNTKRSEVSSQDRIGGRGQRQVEDGQGCERGR